MPARRKRKKAEASGTPPAKGQAGEARFSYEGLDRVMHEKARLGILSSLAVHARGLLFNDLKQLCALTDGNLSRHLTVLSDAGLVEVWKGHQGNRPQTMYRLTPSGRSRFIDYIGVLERIVGDAHVPVESAEQTPPQTISAGWSPA